MEQINDETDEIIETSYADYWEKFFLIMRNRVQGNMFFTQERFIFCSKFGMTNISFLYSEIKDARLCRVSGIIPTGIEITAYNSKKEREEKYLISVMKRKQWLALLSEKASL